MLFLSENAVRKPKQWFWLSAIIAFIFVCLVVLPIVSSNVANFLPILKIDTDPENMLSESESVRVFHHDMKKRYDLHDMIVIGITNDKNDQGVFNRSTLAHIYELTQYTQTLNGVVAADVIAPSTVDNIEQGGLGVVTFQWLMRSVPESDQEALAIAHAAANIPFLNNTLISQDKKAIAIYVPITSKDVSYEIAEQLRDKTKQFLKSEEHYYITGLPVAQDQFGVEMFKQMAISAPMAMMLIFALMWWFFRSIRFVVAPMIVAVISVVITMGLLVVTGHTVHIMSSMIPIFIMPIAVLDAVHILSDFFDKYPKVKNRSLTIKHVMEELSKPMFYTSLTTCAGFGSLAFTPIPPVQIFGIFVAIGVFVAWVLTVTLVPAYIMLMPESFFENFGGVHHDKDTFFNKVLDGIARLTYRHAKLVIIVALLLGGVAYLGMMRIEINDNPVKWFSSSHEIRVADKELNKRFAGTYMAYLNLSVVDDGNLLQQKQMLLASIAEIDSPESKELQGYIGTLDEDVVRLAQLYIDQKQALANSDDIWENWDQLALRLDALRQQEQVFKQPEMLRYIESLQTHLLSTGLVGKSNALPDVVKTVHRALFLGSEDHFTIPNSSDAVAQTLLTYESSHRPQDLWHFVTPDYRHVNVWIQLKSGDNKDMNAVITAVNEFLNGHPAPITLEAKWFGLTYINTVWQDKMVSGMLEAFAGSFIIVFVMMVVLFRSVVWGALCMVPLLLTISLIYGVIGLIGKDYDMPVAVLSSLSLGLAVDYAIHFLARSREMYQGDWQKTVANVFGEPARAIVRNVIVIGIGFLPLLAAPLVPYQTVGVFISAILLFAGAATLLLLPALMTIGKRFIFKE